MYAFHSKTILYISLIFAIRSYEKLVRYLFYLKHNNSHHSPYFVHISKAKKYTNKKAHVLHKNI